MMMDDAAGKLANTAAASVRHPVFLCPVDKPGFKFPPSGSIYWGVAIMAIGATMC